MNTVNLTYTVVTSADSLVGFKYYVNPGDAFNVDDYSHAYRLSPADIDPCDLVAVEVAVKALTAGEWLGVVAFDFSVDAAAVRLGRLKATTATVEKASDSCAIRDAAQFFCNGRNSINYLSY